MSANLLAALDRETRKLQADRDEALAGVASLRGLLHEAVSWITRAPLGSPGRSALLERVFVALDEPDLLDHVLAAFDEQSAAEALDRRCDELEKLRALAEAATPGCVWKSDCSRVYAGEYEVARTRSDHDANFIAAANPGLVLALLDRLAAAVARAETAERMVETQRAMLAFDSTTGTEQRLRADLAAAVAAKGWAEDKYAALDTETRAWREQWAQERDAAVARAEKAERERGEARAAEPGLLRAKACASCQEAQGRAERELAGLQAAFSRQSGLLVKAAICLGTANALRDSLVADVENARSDSEIWEVPGENCRAGMGRDYVERGEVFRGKYGSVVTAFDEARAALEEGSGGAGAG